MAVFPSPGEENVAVVVHGISGSNDPINMEWQLQLSISSNNLHGVDLQGAHSASSVRDQSRRAMCKVHRTQYGCSSKLIQMLRHVVTSIIYLLIQGKKIGRDESDCVAIVLED